MYGPNFLGLMDRASSVLEITPLGAGCEVGRSCILVSYQGKKVLFDCGIHPAHSGVTALPLFDALDLSEVDLCLVTHFHLDHCGAVPYLLNYTWFRGRVVMTEPTKALALLVWNDYAGFARQNTTRQNWLFNQQDVQSCLDKIDTMHFGQSFDYNDIEITAFGAGHVVGACMFAIKIGNISILYTGDYSAEEDRHVPKARVPKGFSVQVLICESTYGLKLHEERRAREKRFLNAVENIVLGRRGKCLIPIFALGRVQELLLILDEQWSSSRRSPEDKKIPIIYLSALSDKGMGIMTEYAATYGGKYVRERSLRGYNAFEFQHVQSAKYVDDIRHVVTKEGPCVVLAAPGMLQSGYSRELFELWAGDSRNGVILTGYSLRGTLADQLKGLPSTYTRLDGREAPVRSSFDMISFSAHADFKQTSELIDSILPPSVILVHGERTEMRALKDKLVALRPALSVFTPDLLQKVVLEFPKQDQVQVIGSLTDDLRLESTQGVPAVAISKPHGRLMLAKEDELGDILKVDIREVLIDFAVQFPATRMRKDTLLEIAESINSLHDDLNVLLHWDADYFEDKQGQSQSLQGNINHWLNINLSPDRDEMRLRYEWSRARDKIVYCLVLGCLSVCDEAEMPGRESRLVLRTLIEAKHSHNDKLPSVITQ